MMIHCRYFVSHILLLASIFGTTIENKIKVEVVDANTGLQDDRAAL